MAAVAGSSAATFAAYASAAAGVLGAATTAIGASQQADAQSKERAYQAQVARNNQTIAEQNAAQETAKGNAEAERASTRSAALLAQTRAEQAASGVDVDTGSAVDVRKSQRLLAETDAQTIRYNAAQAARGYTLQGQGFGAQAGVNSAEAANIKSAADVGATGTLLGNASAVGSKYASWAKNTDDSGGTLSKPSGTQTASADPWLTEGYGT